jgi:hypothetical protein
MSSHREPQRPIFAGQRAGEEAHHVEQPAVEAAAEKPEAVVMEHGEEDLKEPNEDHEHAGPIISHSIAR